ncbi:hypothetical protein C8R46DRAFT_401189 [Mycena filopes]|nr:hypothetical protein C8R46DRAFT_401189 [Mycena filopes]
MPSERPDLETLLTAVPSEPERPRSPWTPSYSVTQQGWEGDAPIPVPPPRPEMFTSEEEDLVKPTVDVDVSTLEAPLDPPRASSPWTPSYSVSVQGSPHPVSTELTDSAPAEGKHAEPSEQDVAAVYPVSEFALPEEINPGIEPAATVVESSAEALNVLDTDAVPVPEEITPESEQDATVPPSEPADVEAAVVDEVSRTDPSVAPIGAIEEDSDEVVAEPVLIAEVEASTVTAEEPLVEESSAEDIEVAEPIAVTDVEISAALDLPVEESSAEHVEAVEVLASNSSTTAIEEAPHMLPAEESSSNKEQATATTPASTALDISPDDPFQSPDEVPEPVDEAAPAESIAESAETADLNATLVQDAIPVAVAAAENEDAVVALEDHVESSPPTVAVLSSDPATEQETTTEEDESPAADEPTFAPDSEEPAPTAAEDTLVPVPHAPTDLPETVSAKSEPTLYSMANLGPSGESSDVGPAAAEAIAESSPESAQPALVDEPSVVEDTMDSASDAVDNTEEAGPLLVQTTAEGNAPVQAASSDVPPLAELEPFPSTTADDATSVELNPPSMTDAPAESEPVPAVLIESPSITHEAAAIPPADVEILGEDPVNEVTPVASVVPLPAEPKPQAFPLMVDTSKTPDAAEEADAYPDELPISPRSRLESTASSLFFPGGWFSKLPQGRASLDIAQGEFTSPKTTSPTLPPSIPSPTTETTETQHQQSEDKKGKWCVVM